MSDAHAATLKKLETARQLLQGPQGRAVPGLAVTSQRSTARASLAGGAAGARHSQAGVAVTSSSATAGGGPNAAGPAGAADAAPAEQAEEESGAWLADVRQLLQVQGVETALSAKQRRWAGIKVCAYQAGSGQCKCRQNKMARMQLRCTGSVASLWCTARLCHALSLLMRDAHALPCWLPCFAATAQLGLLSHFSNMLRKRLLQEVGRCAKLECQVLQLQAEHAQVGGLAGGAPCAGWVSWGAEHAQVGAGGL